MNGSVAIAGQRRLLGEHRASIMQRSYIHRALEPEVPDPDADYHKAPVLKFAFHIEPRIDMRRLERAVERLCQRHDGLRLSFVQTAGQWRAQVWDRHRTGVVVEDHGDVDTAALHALAGEYADRPLHMFEDDLIQFIVLRSARCGDVLVVRAHHAIVDGHAMLIVTEDLLKLLIGLPILGKGLSHKEFLRIAETATPRQEEEIERYWLSIIHPILPNPGLGRLGCGKPAPRRMFDMSDMRSTPLRMRQETFDSLPALAGAGEQTPFSIMFAANAQSLIDLSELPGIYFPTFVDRMSAGLSNYVGCAAMSIPVRCENHEGLAIGALARKFNTQFRESVTMTPSEATAPEMKYDRAVFDAGGVLRHFTCGMVFTGARAKTSPFAPGMQSSPGVRQRIGPLSVTRLPLKPMPFSPMGTELRLSPTPGYMNFELTYHANFYSDQDMQRYVERIEDHLGARFEHSG